MQPPGHVQRQVRLVQATVRGAVSLPPCPGSITMSSGCRERKSRRGLVRVPETASGRVGGCRRYRGDRVGRRDDRAEGALARTRRVEILVGPDRDDESVVAGLTEVAGPASVIAMRTVSRRFG